MTSNGSHVSGESNPVFAMRSRQDAGALTMVLTVYMDAYISLLGKVQGGGKPCRRL